TSPYVLTVYVALVEKGLPFELRLLDLKRGEHQQPEFVRNSVTNRVPTLRHGDVWLSESLAIAEYLEETFPAPRYARLYPEDRLERARVRMVQGLLRSDFMPIREERSTETVFYNLPVQPLSEAAEAARRRLIRIAESVLGDRNGIASQFSLGDVDLAMMLQRLLQHSDPVPERLAQYARGIWQRPSLQRWLELTRKKS
ncbi:MAG TPA: glutathione transferase, partial [Polyangiaceae bacterium]|nr:glutathione transferase [Polyangiaceae bacterium]